MRPAWSCWPAPVSVTPCALIFAFRFSGLLFQFELREPQIAALFQLPPAIPRGDAPAKYSRRETRYVLSRYSATAAGSATPRAPILAARYSGPLAQLEPREPQTAAPFQLPPAIPRFGT